MNRNIPTTDGVRIGGLYIDYDRRLCQVIGVAWTEPARDGGALGTAWYRTQGGPEDRAGGRYDASRLLAARVAHGRVWAGGADWGPAPEWAAEVAGEPAFWTQGPDPRVHWHLTAGMPGYLPHRGPEYIGDTALQAAHGLADELDRLSDDECACTDDAVEMCEIHSAEAAVRSAIADGDYVNGFAVVVDNTVYEVEEAPGDCTCYEEEGQ